MSCMVSDSPFNSFIFMVDVSSDLVVVVTISVVYGEQCFPVTLISCDNTATWPNIQVARRKRNKGTTQVFERNLPIIHKA